MVGRQAEQQEMQAAAHNRELLADERLHGRKSCGKATVYHTTIIVNSAAYDGK